MPTGMESQDKHHINGPETGQRHCDYDEQMGPDEKDTNTAEKIRKKCWRAGSHELCPYHFASALEKQRDLSGCEKAVAVYQNKIKRYQHPS